jgi:hypothetical protein
MAGCLGAARFFTAEKGREAEGLTAEKSREPEGVPAEKGCDAEGVPAEKGCEDEAPGRTKCVYGEARCRRYEATFGAKKFLPPCLLQAGERKSR